MGLREGSGSPAPARRPVSLWFVEGPLAERTGAVDDACGIRETPEPRRLRVPPEPARGIMKSDTSEWLETRASLLARIRNPEDQAGWREFDRVYRRLLCGVARRWGLNETEAEDVAQDTMVSVLKSMPGFEYRPETCSFKSWLRRLTESRIVDFLRRRQSAEGGRRGVEGGLGNGKAVEEMADPHEPDLEAVWEAEWREAVVELALVKLKCRVRPQPYQIFYLLAVKEQSAREVARRLGVSLARVYVTRFRVAPIFSRCLAEAQRQIEIGEGMAGSRLKGRSSEG